MGGRRWNCMTWAYVLAILFLVTCDGLSFLKKGYAYRHFLFMGFPYMVLGYWISRYRHIVPVRLAQWVNMWSVCVACGLLFLEFYLYRYFDVFPCRDHYIMLTWLVFCMFVVAIRWPHWGAGTWMAKVGRQYSAQIYLWHLMFVGPVNVCLIKVGYPDTAMRLPQAVLVYAVTWAAVVCISAVSRFIKNRAQ